MQREREGEENSKKNGTEANGFNGIRKKREKKARHRVVG